MKRQHRNDTNLGVAAFLAGATVVAVVFLVAEFLC